MNKISSRTAGFTLTELLVAIAIMVLLTAIITTNLSSSRAKARDASRISDISQIQFAIQMYYDRCGQYPSSLATTANNGCPSGVTLGNFISQIPVPSNNAGQTSYDYATLSSGGVPVNFVLHTVLEYHNAAVVKGLAAMPSGTWSASYTCDNSSSSVHYCVTSN